MAARVLPFLLSALLLAACTDNANIPGVTQDPEASAKAAYPDVPPAEEANELIDRGQKLFKGLTCEQCHSTGPDRSGLAGPPLGGYADRALEHQDHDPLKARRWTVKHIKDPRKYPGSFAGTDEYRGTFMTPFNRITDDDLRALVEYLFSLR
ncbi:MAG: cytochrome c [Planctomycetes bacterium]|nr:cytochrome c [Planctomycetota bacterium]